MDFHRYKLYLLDMDGTFYLGNQLLPGALEFIDKVNRSGGTYSFLTNNSSKTGDEYVKKLGRLGLNTSTQHVFTSGDATIELLRHEGKWKHLYVVATPPVLSQFVEAGFEVASKRPEAVVLTYDTTLTYEKISAFALLVRSGLPYIASHPDFNCPTPEGPIPDMGAFIAMFEASTQRRPDRVVGKPNADFLQAAMLRFGVLPEETLMIGDRLYTDIQVGINAGVDSALVLSGETTRAMLNQSDVKPTYVFDGLKAMVNED